MTKVKKSNLEETTNEVKPGYKTTEFWLNLLVFLLGAALASGLIADGTLTDQIIGGAMSIISSLSHTISRTGVKKANALGSAYASKPKLLVSPDLVSPFPDLMTPFTKDGENPTKEPA